MPYKRPMTGKGLFKKYEYVYDEYYDCYICPNIKVQSYYITDKNGYKQCKSNSDKCIQCPLKEQCTKSRMIIIQKGKKQLKKYLEIVRNNII